MTSEVIRLVDAETGETIVTTRGPEDNEFKGWLLRQRSAYKRKTGHRLLVVRGAERSC